MVGHGSAGRATYRGAGNVRGTYGGAGNVRRGGERTAGNVPRGRGTYRGGGERTAGAGNVPRGRGTYRGMARETVFSIVSRVSIEQRPQNLSGMRSM